VTASLLLALDLVAAIITTGAWIGAAVLATGLRTRGAPATDLPNAERPPVADPPHSSPPHSSPLHSSPPHSSPPHSSPPHSSPPPATRRRGAWLVLALFGLGILGVLGQGVAVALLAADGWWFVQEKVAFALPLAAAAGAAGLVLAGPPL
jgi:hypothetical protein